MPNELSSAMQFIALKWVHKEAITSRRSAKDRPFSKGETVVVAQAQADSEVEVRHKLKINVHLVWSCQKPRERDKTEDIKDICWIIKITILKSKIEQVKNSAHQESCNHPI